jgi:S-adenosylmethionine synthetase
VNSLPLLSIAPLEAGETPVEIVERKGVGHPDSICDALAENLSRDLCTAYLDRFGTILHHNVDKALLCAGCSAPAFGGGKILEPIEIYLAGRATTGLGDVELPLKEIAVEGARRWLRENLRALDADRHVRINPILRPGSADLRGLFGQSRALAGDTSIGVGYAPLSDLERFVLVLDRRIAEAREQPSRASWGEDLKIMAVRTRRELTVTLSCAMIDRTLGSSQDYLAQKYALAAYARDEAQAFGFDCASVTVNAADRPEVGELYLTVTGTSAESGDDGQVGRGNRLGGLITPGRPMSLEAVAGKNPVTHVGKIYNVVAHEIAHALVAHVPQISHAQCLMVSRIGAPVAEPAVVDIRAATYHAGHAAALRPSIEEIVRTSLQGLPERLEGLPAIHASSAH